MSTKTWVDLIVWYLGSGLLITGLAFWGARKVDPGVPFSEGAFAMGVLAWPAVIVMMMFPRRDGGGRHGRHGGGGS